MKLFLHTLVAPCGLDRKPFSAHSHSHNWQLGQDLKLIGNWRLSQPWSLCYFCSVQPGMNNVLDYGLDRVTNPNEVQVNQVGLCCILLRGWAGPKSGS